MSRQIWRLPRRGDDRRSPRGPRHGTRSASGPLELYPHRPAVAVADVRDTGRRARHPFLHVEATPSPRAPDRQEEIASAASRGRLGTPAEAVTEAARSAALLLDILDIGRASIARQSLQDRRRQHLLAGKQLLPSAHAPVGTDRWRVISAATAHGKKQRI